MSKGTSYVIFLLLYAALVIACWPLEVGRYVIVVFIANGLYLLGSASRE